MSAATHAPPPLFGTDGIRGRFGEPPLDAETVRTVGLALAHELAEADAGSPHLVIGGDTRASTESLARWLMQGLEAGGAGATWLGVLPTPGVAWLTRARGAAAGVAVSASHNPAPDNGIKLFDRHGGKWSQDREQALERAIRALDAPSRRELSVTARLDWVAEYVEALRASIAAPGETPLAGLAIALDTSHGAASGVARQLFAGLGADVAMRADRPDGSNINHQCGSTHPQPLAAKVAASGADLGVAFDGDADRAILVDERGTVRDGDAILYLWARALLADGALRPARVVATTMSNLGLEVALRASGIDLVRCDVGDRALVETLVREHLILGGEQSGHIVHLGLSTTGDGLLTALQIAAIRSRARRPLSELLAGLRQFPQILLNVPVTRKPPLDSLPEVEAERQAIERSLGDRGRLLLRYSGTEPLARVMIEGEEQDAIEELAERLAGTIAGAIG